MMNYEEWLEHIKFKLNEKYKIRNIIIDNDEMVIGFCNDFQCKISSLSNICQMPFGFEEICNDIEVEYMRQIKKV